MKGDFTGFTFVYNGHSYTTEELGITRVSDGDRYNEPLIPELEDKTIEIPGLDGSYYYGSDFKSRNFPIKIAYDSLNETQFRLMRQIFGVKHTGLLIFDEAPYKQYRVKIASPPELDFVCFDERIKEEVDFDGIKGQTTVERNTQNTHRIYKGEGTIEFVAYYPFAIQVFKTLNEYEDTDYPNKSEWAAASRLLDTSDDLSNEIDLTNGQINLYNAGDVDIGFSLYVPFTEQPFNSDIQLSYSSYELRILNTITKKGEDKGFLINTVNGLVEGVSTDLSAEYDTLVTSGNIYNEYAIGNFFKVAPNTDKNERTIIELEGGVEGMKLYYNYLYF